jgi:hypothetical protein
MYAIVPMTYCLPKIANIRSLMRDIGDLVVVLACIRKTAKI